MTTKIMVLITDDDVKQFDIRLETAGEAALEREGKSGAGSLSFLGKPTRMVIPVETLPADRNRREVLLRELVLRAEAAKGSFLER